jgi:hypothetical protein
MVSPGIARAVGLAEDREALVTAQVRAKDTGVYLGYAKAVEYSRGGTVVG